MLIANCIPVSLKEKGNKKAIFFHLGIFLFNGLVGVVTSVHSSEGFVEYAVSSWNFITWYAIFAAILGLIGVIITRKQSLFNTLDKKGKAISVACPVVYAVINGTASYITLICVSKIGASAQYPIITGGCIFFSLFTGLLFKEKPTKRTVVSVCLAVLGTVLFIV